MNVAQQIAAWLRSIFLWWITVTPWEQGVRVRLGKHVRLLGPGIHLKVPIIDEVYVQPIRHRAQLIRSQTVTTKDGKVITVTGALHFTVVDIQLLYQTLHSPTDTIEQLAHGMIAEYIHTRVSGDISPAGLQAVVSGTLDLAKYGLQFLSFAVTSFAVTRTYRFITGEINPYMYDGRQLDTSQPRGVPL